jgi:hypothetical protein
MSKNDMPQHVPENRFLKTIYEPKRDKEAGGRRRLHQILLFTKYH